MLTRQTPNQSTHRLDTKALPSIRKDLAARPVEPYVTAVLPLSEGRNALLDDEWLTVHNHLEASCAPASTVAAIGDALVGVCPEFAGSVAVTAVGDQVVRRIWGPEPLGHVVVSIGDTPLLSEVTRWNHAVEPHLVVDGRPGDASVVSFTSDQTAATMTLSSSRVEARDQITEMVLRDETAVSFFVGDDVLWRPMMAAVRRAVGAQCDVVALGPTAGADADAQRILDALADRQRRVRHHARSDVRFLETHDAVSFGAAAALELIMAGRAESVVIEAEPFMTKSSARLNAIGEPASAAGISVVEASAIDRVLVEAQNREVPTQVLTAVDHELPGRVATCMR